MINENVTSNYFVTQKSGRLMYNCYLSYSGIEFQTKQQNNNQYTYKPKNDGIIISSKDKFIKQCSIEYKKESKRYDLTLKIFEQTSLKLINLNLHNMYGQYEDGFYVFVDTVRNDCVVFRLTFDYDSIKIFLGGNFFLIKISHDSIKVSELTSTVDNTYETLKEFSSKDVGVEGIVFDCSSEATFIKNFPEEIVEKEPEEKLESESKNEKSLQESEKKSPEKPKASEQKSEMSAKQSKEEVPGHSKTQSVENPKPNHGRWIIMILVILGVIVVIYFYYINNSKEKI